MNKINWNWKKY